MDLFAAMRLNIATTEAMRHTSGVMIDRHAAGAILRAAAAVGAPLTLGAVPVDHALPPVTFARNLSASIRSVIGSVTRPHLAAK